MSIDGNYPAMESGEYASLFIKWGEAYDIHPYLLEAQADRESGYNPNAIGGSGEIGISQFMPDTWSWFGCEGRMENPDDSIKCQARYMRYLLDQWTNKPDEQIALGLSSYNAGLGATQRAGGIPENGHTPGYVRDILAGFNRRMTQTPAKTTHKPAKLGGKESYDGVGSVYPDGVTWRNVGTKAFHEGGRDITVNCDQPIVSPITGTITRYKDYDGYGGYGYDNSNFQYWNGRDGRKHDRDMLGNTVIDITGEGYTIQILHAEWLEELNSGDTVERGQHIGYEDSIGNSSQCHVHIEVRRGTTVLDPYDRP